MARLQFREKLRNSNTPKFLSKHNLFVLINGMNFKDLFGRIKAIAPKIGCGSDTLRRCVQKEDTDAGRRDGVTSEERVKIKKFEREPWELRRAKMILKKGEAFVHHLSEDNERARMLLSRSSTVH